MKFRLAPSITFFAALLASLHSLQASANPLAGQMASYAAAATASDSAFAGFSAARGEKLHTTTFGLGKPDTPACTSCHGTDPKAAGKTRTGKRIDPIALSAAPTRYADPVKVEKWFKRNCNEVLGRECTALEKGDWLTFVSSR